MGKFSDFSISISFFIHLFLFIFPFLSAAIEGNTIIIVVTALILAEFIFVFSTGVIVFYWQDKYWGPYLNCDSIKYDCDVPDYSTTRNTYSGLAPTSWTAVPMSATA